jgi:predicted transglutaminase-like cysteine proteinase
MFSSCARSAVSRLVLAAVAVVSSTGANVAAQAATLPGDGTQALTASCGEVAGASAVLPVTLAAQTSKSAAILGGQPSAFEQIVAQQASGGATSAAPDFALAQPIPPLEPALGGFRPGSADCAIPSPSRASELGSEDFLATKRLAIGKTAFDRDWQRVSRDRVSARSYRRLVGNETSNDFSALVAVNAWVNQAITFTEDRKLFSRADFWAGAGTTLRLRRGDCEDIALTKMQLLAAAGIPREDMILTLARDLVRNADHAVLIVRQGGRYYMLDNASDEVFDASLSHDYRPILSFGRGQTWLHGY